MSSKHQVKFLIVGDLHGRIPEIKINDFDAIISPGDICGDPEKILEEKFEKEKNNYSSFDEFLEIKQFSEEMFKEKSLQKGREVLQKLSSYNKPIFLVSGNWDFPPFCDGIAQYVSIGKDKNPFTSLINEFEQVIYVEDKLHEFKGINIIGYGSTSAPEILLEEQIDNSEELIQRYNYFQDKKELLVSLFEKATKPVFFLTHNVAYGSDLDIIDNEKSAVDGESYGSILATLLIQEFSPLLCVGGHIHEGHGKTYLNSTLCINAGFGSSVNTLVTIDTQTQEVVEVKMIGENFN